MLLNDMIQELWVARFEIIRSTSKYGKTYSKTYHISNFILYVLRRTPNLLFVTSSAKIKLLKNLNLDNSVPNKNLRSINNPMQRAKSIFR